MSEPTKIPIPLRERAGDLLRGPLPLLVWVAAGVGAFLLLRGSPGPGLVQGLVSEHSVELSFGEAGRLDQWLVEPGAAIDRGQPLALLGDADLELEQGAIEARLAVLDAELIALEARFGRRRVEARIAIEQQASNLQAGALEAQREGLVDARRFALDVADLRLEVLAREVDLQVARLERGRIAVRLKRAEELAKQDLFDLATVQDLGLELDQQQAEVVARETQVEATREALAQAEARLGDLDSTPGAGLGEADERADRALAAELEAELALVRSGLDLEKVAQARLDLSRADRILKGPAAGILGEHLVLSGQHVSAGWPVTTLRTAGTRTLELWLPQRKASAAPAPGSTYRVARRASPAEGALATVVAVAEEIQALPLRLLADPNRPKYGRAVTVELPAALGLLPGETVIAWPQAE